MHTPNQSSTITILPFLAERLPPGFPRGRIDRRIFWHEYRFWMRQQATFPSHPGTQLLSSQAHKCVFQPHPKFCNCITNKAIKLFANTYFNELNSKGNTLTVI